MPPVTETADAVRRAMREAGIADASDVHFVQVKCPLLTAGRMHDAVERGHTVATEDTYESMGYSRGASALGIALALGEVEKANLSDEVITADYSLYSSVASTSAGIELMNNEIIVMGTNPGRIVDRFSVDMARPRQRDAPVYASLVTRILALLEQQDTAEDG